MSDFATARTVEIDTIEASNDVEIGPGATLGGYLIEALCSRGGFGTVYKARGPSDETVAIKILHRTLSHSSTALLRFRREIELVQKLEHPGIVTILGVGELSENRPYLVMEWIEGRTLYDDVRERGPMPLARALSIMEKLCDALSVVHQAGIVHRDLKGANVMLVGDGDGEKVKLLDFGVAKLLDQESSLTVAGSRIGTPSHMAPEQILGGRVGPQTDIYALGIMLFTILTGRLPFQAKTSLEVETMHLDARPPRASELAGVPEPVSDVILRCLAKKTIQRHSTVEELAAELRAAAEASPDEASSLHAGEARAVGVFVETTDDGPEGQGALDEARKVFAAEGLDVSLEDEGGRWLLGVAGLFGAGSATREVRARAIGAALAVGQKREGKPKLRVVVHEAPVTTLAVEGALQIAGGDLLDTDTWAMGGAPGRVEVSKEVLVGIDADTIQDDICPEGRTIVSSLSIDSTRIDSTRIDDKG